MARFVRCIEGHVFDAQASAQCPTCGAAVELAPEVGLGAESGGFADGGPTASSPSGTSVLWAMLGAGVCLLVIAGIVLLRFEFATPAADTKVAEQEQAAKPGAPPQPAQKTPEPKIESPSSVAPRASANPEAQEPPRAAPPPTSDAMQGHDKDDQDVKDDQGDLALSSGPGPGGLKAPAPASTVPIDGNEFKTSFENGLAKLGLLTQLDPIVANIAVGIAGLNLFNHGEEAPAQAMLEEASAANISFAAAALGQQFFDGTKTLPRDYGQARHWFEIASRTGDVPAANYELAVIYARGLGVQSDLKLAGHYLLAAYHGSFQPAVEIVAGARSGKAPQRRLLRGMGLDPNAIGMTVLDYYNARRASDPEGARQVIEQLAKGLQWPAPNILALAQWNGDYGKPDRASAAKNFLIAASGGAFAALIPVAEAALDGSIGSPNPGEAALVAILARLYVDKQSPDNIQRLNRVYQQAMAKVQPDQNTQLVELRDLLNKVASADAEASIANSQH
jgi:TPR repeat protein